MPTPLKVFGIAYKEGGLINYLELYRSAYITKCFGIVVNEEGL